MEKRKAANVVRCLTTFGERAALGLKATVYSPPVIEHRAIESDLPSISATAVSRRPEFRLAFFPTPNSYLTAIKN